MKRAFRKVAFGFVGASVLALTGCSSMTIPGMSTAGKANAAKSKTAKKESSWNPFKKAEYPTPASMNVTWASDVLLKPGKPATRGFGGRFYFYNEKSQAIPVDGELVVYGFDDTFTANNDHPLETAEKRFCFTAEQFTSHFSESQLGASYSVWIPWDAAPGMKKQIMLIPTFKAKDGRIVRGNSATLHLPGKDSESDEAYSISKTTNVPAYSQPVQNVSFVEPTGPKTTTISVPSRSLRNGNSGGNVGPDSGLVGESVTTAQHHASSLMPLQQNASVPQGAASLNVNSNAAPGIATFQNLSGPAGMNGVNANADLNSRPGMSIPNMLNPQPMFSVPTPSQSPMNGNPTSLPAGMMQPEMTQPTWTGLPNRS